MASINFTISLREQNAICANCPLQICVDRDSRDCPIQVEQRRTWRENNKRREAAGYFAARDRRQRTNKTKKGES